jgi:hypothetical protein
MKWLIKLTLLVLLANAVQAVEIPIMELNSVVSYERGEIPKLGGSDYTEGSGGGTWQSYNRFVQWGINAPYPTYGSTFRVYDGANDKRAFFKRRVKVVKGQTYLITYDEAANRYMEIILKVDGQYASVLKENTKNLPVQADRWHTRWDSFVAKKTGYVVVTMHIANNHQDYNDVAIDNISIQKVDNTNIYKQKFEAKDLYFGRLPLAYAPKTPYYAGYQTSLLTDGRLSGGINHSHYNYYVVTDDKRWSLTIDIKPFSKRHLRKMRFFCGEPHPSRYSRNYYNGGCDGVEIIYWDRNNNIISQQRVHKSLVSKSHPYYVVDIPPKIEGIARVELRPTEYRFFGFTEIEFYGPEKVTLNKAPVVEIPELKIGEKESFEGKLIDEGTDYSYRDRLGAGGYTVKERFVQWGINAPKASDGKKFLVVDGSQDNKRSFLKRRVEVVKGETYSISWDEASNKMVHIKLYIDGRHTTPLAGTSTWYSPGGEWNTRWLTFVAKKTGYVVVGLNAGSQDPRYNDFAFDNVRVEHIDKDYYSKRKYDSSEIELQLDRTRPEVPYRDSSYFGKDANVLNNGRYEYNKYQGFDIAKSGDYKRYILGITIKSLKELGKIRFYSGKPNTDERSKYGSGFNLYFYNKNHDLLGKKAIIGYGLISKEKPYYDVYIPKTMYGVTTIALETTPGYLSLTEIELYAVTNKDYIKGTNFENMAKKYALKIETLEVSKAELEAKIAKLLTVKCTTNEITELAILRDRLNKLMRLAEFQASGETFQLDTLHRTNTLEITDDTTFTYNGDNSFVTPKDKDQMTFDVTIDEASREAIVKLSVKTENNTMVGVQRLKLDDPNTDLFFAIIGNSYKIVTPGDIAHKTKNEQKYRHKLNHKIHNYIDNFIIRGTIQKVAGIKELVWSMEIHTGFKVGNLNINNNKVQIINASTAPLFGDSIESFMNQASNHNSITLKFNVGYSTTKGQTPFQIKINDFGHKTLTRFLLLGDKDYTLLSNYFLLSNEGSRITYNQDLNYNEGIRSKNLSDTVDTMTIIGNYKDVYY